MNQFSTSRIEMLSSQKRPKQLKLANLVRPPLATQLHLSHIKKAVRNLSLRLQNVFYVVDLSDGGEGNRSYLFGTVVVENDIYSHLVKMVSPNAKLTSCNPDPFFISFLRLVESKLNLVSWFSTSRSGCVQPVRIVEFRPNTAKMLGVRLDFGFTLSQEKKPSENVSDGFTSVTMLSVGGGTCCYTFGTVAYFVT